MHSFKNSSFNIALQYLEQQDATIKTLVHVDWMNYCTHAINALIHMYIIFDCSLSLQILPVRVVSVDSCRAKGGNCVTPFSPFVVQIS